MRTVQLVIGDARAAVLRELWNLTLTNCNEKCKFVRNVMLVLITEISELSIDSVLRISKNF